MSNNKKIRDTIAENERATEIKSVGAFIDLIKKLNENDEGASVERYFRGQKVEFWPLMPSIFRNNMLSIEHDLMQKPLLKCPDEFNGLTNPFDIMTKYQHYGMCTRLLDLTSNPLVALYFACQIHGEIPYISESNINDESNNKEPYGVIYYTTDFYPVTSTDQDVRIIVELSRCDLSNGLPTKEILKMLVERNVISEEKAKIWEKVPGIYDFISRLQKNYMIKPSFSNERLKHQSGMFLLASSFLVEQGNVDDNPMISKAIVDLKDSFSEDFFYIEGKNKENILKELDLYNINEATLFPELEHQLNYIYTSSQHLTKAVSYFTKYDFSLKTEIEEENTKELSTVIQQLESINLDIDAKIIDEVIDNTLNETVVQDHERTDLKKIIKQYTEIVDWYKRTPTLNGIKMAIKKYYVTKIHGNELEEKINDILYKLLKNLDNTCKKSD